MRIRKGTNFSANHNVEVEEAHPFVDVCGYAKVLIFLQITTQECGMQVWVEMYADTQRY